MPELPEVEVTRRSFAERIAGARVLAVDMGWGLQTASATANFEGWTGVADELAAHQARLALIEKSAGAPALWVQLEQQSG